MSRRPSIAFLLETTGTIESLAAMRGEIIAGVASGEITASEKTLANWVELIFVRALELMAHLPRQAPYIYNVTLRWHKPPELAAALWEQMKLVTAPLPSDAQLLLLQGIEIEGVTSGCIRLRDTAIEEVTP